jgi:hypothetical protein
MILKLAIIAHKSIKIIIKINYFMKSISTNMKNLRFLLLSFVVVFFISCEKDNNSNSGGGGAAPAQSSADLMTGNYTGTYGMSYQFSTEYNFNIPATGPCLKINNSRVRLDLTMNYEGENISGSLTIDVGALSNNIIPVSVASMSGIFLETELPSGITGTYNTSTKTLSLQHQFNEDGETVTVTISGVIV